MNRLLTALLLLLVAGSAFADTNVSQTVKSELSALTPPISDYSVAYLSQIFGNVGNVLHGTSGQVLGKLFDVLNKGILVVAAIWLGYTTATIALKASQEGSFLGQNRNVPVLFLRIAIGFILIIPSSTTGYSLLQDVFMKVVLASVGLADQTWDATLKYINYAGELFIPPKTLNNDSGVVSGAIGTVSAANGVPSNSDMKWMTQILANEVCMLTNPQQGYYQSPVLYPPVISSNPIQGGVIYFPSSTQQHSDYSYYTTNTPGCGSVTMYTDPRASQYTTGSGANTDGSPTFNNRQGQLAMNSWVAMKAAVQALLPIARGYVDQSTVTVIPGEFTKATFSALMSYMGLMSTYQAAISSVSAADVTAQQEKEAGSGGEIALDVFSYGIGYGIKKAKTTELQSERDSSQQFIDRAQAQGWIMAGRFYWDVEQANSDAKTQNISNMVPTVSLYTSDAVCTNTACPPALFMANEPTISTDWQLYVGAQQSKITSTQAKQAISTGNAVADSAASQTFSTLSNAMGSFADANTQYNPIVVLMNEGEDLLDASVAIWIGGMLLTVTGAFLAGFCTSTDPTGLMWKTLVAWLKSIMMTICFLLLIPGAILGYYVPMYPFAVYTFAAVGWILMVIEGMAAAPLVCMGLTHPEGHDFLGKAEQALMLFLSIFLRPALMVIGLVASMLVSFVAFKMVLVGFKGVVADLASTHNNGAFGDGFLAVITQTMIMVIFGMITMELIEQSYKLIYQLPNNIMRWIGGNAMGEEYGQMAKAMQGAVSGAAQGLQKAGETAGSDAGYTGKREHMKEKKEESDAKKKADEEAARLKGPAS